MPERAPGKEVIKREVVNAYNYFKPLKGGGKVKIAILCECLRDKCWVSHHFGKAPFVCFYDTQTGEMVKERNPFITSIQRGFGRAMVEYVYSKGASVLIGPPAPGPGPLEALEALGINYISMEPRTPVEEALKKVMSSE